MPEQLKVRIALSQHEVESPTRPSNSKLTFILTTIIALIIVMVLGLVWNKLQASKSSHLLPDAALSAPQVFQETEIVRDNVSGSQQILNQIQPPPLPIVSENPKPITEEIKTSSPTNDSTVINRAQFTSEISNREPTDMLEGNIYAAGEQAKRVYFFTEIFGLANATIRHQWYFNDQLIVEVPITIRGERWRCYSLKHLPITMLGQWKVKVVDQNENVLVEEQFNFLG